MAGPSIKKRSFNDGPKGKGGGARPNKKQRKMAAYHSSSEEEEESGDEISNSAAGVARIPANLLDDSDEEDLDNVEVDDGASENSDDDDSDSDSQSEGERQIRRKQKEPKKATKKPKFVAKDAPEESDDDDNESADEDEEDDEFANDDEDDFSGSDDDSDNNNSKTNNTKSKRNDPDAFATSISKMLSSKLPASKRADPIVARSAESAQAAKQMVDAALEAKARKRLREQKRLAMEKGRVRDVLMPSTTRTLNIQTGEIEETVAEGEAETTTGELIATERRLRKVAQRGVVKLFNAVRAAQVKAQEAERAARNEGIVGVKRREEKVTEMSKKGFLDLIASGGGGLKKTPLEEA